MAWTVRYRFKISSPLNSQETKLSVVIGGRQACVSCDGDRAFKDSNWLILNIHGIESKDEAHEVGNLIASAVHLAGVRLGIGIDAGENLATLRFGKTIADAARQDGHNLVSSVHGLYIHQREGNESFVALSATGSVTFDPAMFLNNVATSFDETSDLGKREQNALTLIALSKIAREPLAEAVLCISAVEYLSNDKPWTPAQLDLLTKLKAQAASSSDLPQEEAREVADRLGLVFKSIGQSIRRKMAVLGFSKADIKSFTEIYDLRSSIFHGSKIAPAQHLELAAKARDICARVVLAAAQKTRSDNTIGGVGAERASPQGSL